MYTIDALHKIDNDNIVYSMEPYFVFCGDLSGKETPERGDICIHIAYSLCCAVETNTNCKATIL